MLHVGLHVVYCHQTSAVLSCQTVILTNLTRRMAIANGTCVSFCNQPKTHFGLPWVRPWDNRSKCHMDEKRIQCLSNASQHVPIYLQPFTSYSEILVGNCNLFLPPLHLMLPLRCSLWNSGKKFGPPQKTRIMARGYQAVKTV